MKILYTGGGTLGPVMPLLAVADAWKRHDPDVRAVWVGTRKGPEGDVVREAGIPFYTIPAARLPRYPTFEWLWLPVSFLLALLRAVFLLLKERPLLIASAGGFTGVPLILVGWLFGIPSWIHQQDADPLLANKLAAPFAKKITTAWESSVGQFFPKKTTWVGNPVRREVLEGSAEKAEELFGLNRTLPTVLIFGGGTGASWLNQMMKDVGNELVARANVIHVTGRGKGAKKFSRLGKHYVAREFLGAEMPHALHAATVVVARAGMGTISELAALKKPAILVPIPGSAQEANAEQLKGMNAAVVLQQRQTTVGDLKSAILKLLDDQKRQLAFSQRISKAVPTQIAESLVRELETLAT